QDQLQRGQADPHGVRAEAGGGAAGRAGGADRRHAEGHSLPPRRGPPRALGAAGTQASAQAWSPADASPSDSQAATESLKILLSKCHSPDTPKKKRAPDPPR